MANIQYMDPMGYGKTVSHWDKLPCMLPKNASPKLLTWWDSQGYAPNAIIWGNTALIIMLDNNPFIRPHLLGGMAVFGYHIRFPWYCSFEEILLTKVEVGSWSHCLQVFFYNIPGGWLGFLPSTVCQGTEEAEKRIGDSDPITKSWFQGLQMFNEIGP